MARHKHDSEDPARANVPDPLTTEEASSPMAAAQYRNGPLPDHHSISKAIASKRAFAWAKSNFIGIAGIAVAAGLLWLLPVTRWQLDDVKTDINGRINAINQKIDNHDGVIAEIKSGLNRVESKVDAVLLKLTPDRFPIAPSPIPSSSPPPEKPKPKAKKPHPQRVGLLQRLTR